MLIIVFVMFVDMPACIFAAVLSARTMNC